MLLMNSQVYRSSHKRREVSSQSHRSIGPTLSPREASMTYPTTSTDAGDPFRALDECEGSTEAVGRADKGSEDLRAFAGPLSSPCEG